MTHANLISVKGRALAFGAGLIASAIFTAPMPAHAIDTGSAVGIGLGSFALGTMLGAGANPYGYYPYSYGYYPGYPASPYYYPPATGYYYAPRSCWSSYYQRYVPC